MEVAVLAGKLLSSVPELTLSNIYSWINKNRFSVHLQELECLYSKEKIYSPVLSSLPR